MNRKIERACLLSVCLLFLAAVPALSNPWKESAAGEMSVTMAQKDMIISCPDMVKLVVQPPQGWQPVFFYSQVVLKFELSETDGKTLGCQYNNGKDKNFTMVTRPTPPGFTCRAGGNVPHFTCQKIGPQIRKKQ